MKQRLPLRFSRHNTHVRMDESDETNIDRNNEVSWMRCAHNEIMMCICMYVAGM